MTEDLLTILLNNGYDINKNITFCVYNYSHTCGNYLVSERKLLYVNVLDITKTDITIRFVYDDKYRDIEDHGYIFDEIKSLEKTVKIYPVIVIDFDEGEDFDNHWVIEFELNDLLVELI